MFIINIVIEIIKLFFDLCTLIAGEDAYLFMVFFAIPLWVLIFFAGIQVFQWLTSFSNVLIYELRRKHRIQSSRRRRGIIEHKRRKLRRVNVR